jgi:hypothetical protein
MNGACSCSLVAGGAVVYGPCWHFDPKALKTFREKLTPMPGGRCSGTEIFIVCFSSSAVADPKNYYLFFVIHEIAPEDKILKGMYYCSPQLLSKG